MTTENRLTRATPDVMTSTSAHGDQMIRSRGASGSEALAEREEAMVKARVALAIRNPRDFDNVRSRMLKEAKRPGFAEVAMYSLPRGRKQDASGKWVTNYIEGLSIRAAEALGREMGNLLVTTVHVGDDQTQRIFEVSVMDLETNFTEQVQVVVPKLVERKMVFDKDTRTHSLPNGVSEADVVARRTNSYGDPIVIVQATDDELMIRANALTSKARRNKILEMVPGDVRHDVLEAIRKTRLAGAKAEDPQAARTKLLDGFAEVDVAPAKLKAYCERRYKTFERLTPEQLTELRSLYHAIKDRETTWREVEGDGLDEGEAMDPKTGEVVRAPVKAATPAAKASPPAAKEPEKAPAPTPEEAPPVVSEPTDEQLAAERAEREKSAGTPPSAAAAVPKVRTEEFALWLMEQMRKVPKKGEPGFDERCKAIAPKVNDVPDEWRDRATKAFLSVRNGKGVPE